ncbi:MAG: RrF2 family transcriptional regulator [Candidatus Caldatribacteriota bacterium]|nr:RrF2 family transcriptional regulator [Candidatus Caldatribacteriota bacterium]
MKLSTRGRYALRAMIDLAQIQCNNLKPISLRDISLRQEISLQYLEQLFNKLKKANLVKSIRGASGGYLLIKETERINAGDIIRAVEGPIALVDCILADQKIKKSSLKKCKKKENCAIKILLEEVTDKINQTLDSTSLKDLCIISQKIGEKQKDER